MDRDQHPGVDSKAVGNHCPESHPTLDDVERAHRNHDLEADIAHDSHCHEAKTCGALTYQSSQAPFLFLPTEIIASIFLLGQTASLDEPMQPAFEIRISHICHRLRSIAVGTPAIWANMIFPADHHECLTDLYITRSQKYPLNVTLLPSRTRSKRVLRLSCVSRLALHIQRFRSLAVRACTWAELFVAMSHFQNLHAPRLERFHIECPTWALEGPYTFFVFSGGAPTLTALELTGCWPGLSSPFLPAIKSLQLKRVDARLSSHLSNLLSCFGNLTSLSLERWTPKDSMTPVILPCLRSLTVFHAAEDNCMIHICSTLITPALESLVFNGALGWSVLGLFRLMSCSLPQHYPSLYSLSFVRPNVVPSRNFLDLGLLRCHDTVGLHRPFAAVQHLTLVNIAITGFVLAELCKLGSHSASPLLPELHCMTLLHPNLNPGDVRCALTSRINAGHPIAKMRVLPSFVSKLAAKRGELEWYRSCVSIEMGAELSFLGERQSRES